VPQEWARTKNNLGNALTTIGERETDTTKLEEAVTAFRDALEERTRERVPLEWATTQNNLGNALKTLGERESGTTRLEEAVSAYRNALKEYPRERFPLDWAMTQGNLGSALSTLGERETGTKKLGEAVTALRDALKEYPRERVPFYWAITQDNLGDALQTIATRRGLPPCDATKLHFEALLVFEPAAPQYAAEARKGLAKDLNAPVPPTATTCPNLARTFEQIRAKVTPSDTPAKVEAQR
jgi:tetratricopeptide (TPR) repeat protein